MADHFAVILLTPTHDNFCDAVRQRFSVIEVRSKCRSRRLQALHIFPHTEGGYVSHIAIVSGRRVERQFVQRACRGNAAAITVAYRGLAGALKAKLAQNIARRGVVGEVHVFGGAAMALAFHSRLATRDVDAIFAVGMHGDFLAVHVGGINQSLDFVIEHLPPQACADSAVDTAGGGDFDDVNATPDLHTYRLPATFNAIAEILLMHAVMQ